MIKHIDFDDWDDEVGMPRSLELDYNLPSEVHSIEVYRDNCKIGIHINGEQVYDSRGKEGQEYYPCTSTRDCLIEITRDSSKVSKFYYKSVPVTYNEDSKLYTVWDETGAYAVCITPYEEIYRSSVDVYSKEVLNGQGT